MFDKSFDNTPFIAGSLLGKRAFRLKLTNNERVFTWFATSNGHLMRNIGTQYAVGFLRGISYHDKWAEGENLATCFKPPNTISKEESKQYNVAKEIAVTRKMTRYGDGKEVEWKDYFPLVGIDLDELPLAKLTGRYIIWATYTNAQGEPIGGFQNTYHLINDVYYIHQKVQLYKHSLAGLKCSCGYYAFYDSEDNMYFRQGNYGDTASYVIVGGIIEGYGKVTAGTKGFRSSKAKLKAIILPEFREPIDNGKVKNAFYTDAAPISAKENVLHFLNLNYPNTPIFNNEKDALAEFALSNPADLGIDTASGD